MPKIETSLLGQHSEYYDEYNPTILQPLSRALGRAGLKFLAPEGFDLWRLYEITYLNRLNIPCAAVGTLEVPASSAFIVESKSLKLYLGSFTQTRFSGRDEVQEVITHDLSRVLECQVRVQLYELDACPHCFAAAELPGTLIDRRDGVSITDFKYNPACLNKGSGPRVEEILRSNLLRTLCPVTGQPDHASVMIHYQGTQINHQDLFCYLVGLRKHRGFHEQCVELIYHDLKTRLKPERLEVMACFTRRGGIDITPLRSDFAVDQNSVIRTFRQ